MKKYIIAVMIFVMAISTLVYADGDSMVFTVEPSVSGGIVNVEVSYTNNTYMCGGGFALIYDSSKLSLIEAIEGSALDKGMAVINDKREPNKIRIVWASTTVLPKDGTVLNVAFKLNSGEFKNSDIKFEEFGVANQNGVKIKNAVMRVAGVESNNPSSAPATGGGTQTNKPDTDNKPDGKLPIDTTLDGKLEFVDVSESDWFFDSVKYVCENALMSGVSDTEFAPNAALTRAMLVVVLHRLEGEPEGAKADFADVAEDTWYTKAVAWAAEKGIVNGYSETEFAPEINITREQIATIMYRYAKSKGYDVSIGENTNILSYDDIDAVSEYAIDAMQYVCGSGLINGKSDSTLNPADNATRAETATILQRFIENLAK